MGSTDFGVVRVMRALKGYEGTRIRLQRITDAKFFVGWTLVFDKTNLVVQFQPNSQVEVGDLFYCQLQGPKKINLFHAQCTSTESSVVRMHLTTRPKIMECTQDVRIRPSKMTCLLQSAFGSSPVDVLDISPSGIAILAPFAFESSDETEIMLDTPTGPVEAIGTVIYCRSNPNELSFRIGFSLRIPDRAMQGRWKNLFFEVA